MDAAAAVPFFDMRLSQVNCHHNGFIFKNPILREDLCGAPARPARRPLDMQRAVMFFTALHNGARIGPGFCLPKKQEQRRYAQLGIVDMKNASQFWSRRAMTLLTCGGGGKNHHVMS